MNMMVYKTSRHVRK